MDPSYWSSIQTTNRTSVSVGNVESNQPGFMPYSGVELPAASLELLINQQRLAGAPGISFLPYTGTYASQVLDGTAVPGQMILPGSVSTTPVLPQVQCDPNAQAVSSSYRSAEQLLADRSAVTVANVLPVSNVVNSGANIRQMPSLKQPLQSINLADLLDYSFLLDNGLAEASSTVDLRNPTVLANMLQSLNSANLPSAGVVDNRVPQVADVQQFAVSKQTVPEQGGVSPFQQVSVVNPPNAALSNSNQSQSGASLYAGHASVAPSGAVQQPTEHKATVSSSGVVWPWGNQMLVAEKSQIDGAIVHIPSCTSSLTSSAVPVLYEAVSPPGEGVDNISFGLLDNMQFAGDAAQGYQSLNSLLNSTVDASALLTSAPQNISYISQQSSTVAWTGSKSTSYSAPVDGRTQPHVEANAAKRSPLPTLETVINRHSGGESDKAQKQKANLGIVLPMTHASRDERNSTTLQTSAVCRSAAISRGIESPAVEQPGQYVTNNQLSVEKPSGSLVDGATGGIVLTNITGNVYVNQYTMLPGGAPPLDNALLHADYAVPSAVDTLSYDAVPDETSQAVLAPSLAVMLTSNEDEMHSLATRPVTTTTSDAQQESTIPHAAGALHQTVHKSLPPESSFFGPEAAPVLAAKPSNKFESSFLQFICGHKAETLSSVLNTPIKQRPVLPKYVPEPRRPRPVEVTENDTDDKVEKATEPSSAVSHTRVQTTISCASSTISSETMTTTTTTSVCSINAEWPSVTKLPAKFSHKWKNRTSLSTAASEPSTVTVTCTSATKGIEVISSKSTASCVEVTPSSSGKTKNQNTKWTISKKSRCSKSQSSGLPVLVLKAVPVSSNGRSTSSSGSKSSR